MNEQKKLTAKDIARCPAQTWQELLDEDSVGAPDFMKEDNYTYLGSEPLAASRYTDPAFHDQEVEKMWPYVWQFAARDEEFPKPGDHVVYENAGRSYLIVRQDDLSVRAFHNVCLHRGRKLRLESGYRREFLCPFHGFSWNWDGSLKEIPNRWDFPHLSDDKMQLPEAEVGRWGGYVFVRDEPGGPSIEEYLAPLPEHFKRWKHEECYTSLWVGKVVHANWKITMEAFMEAWHTIVTHPQLLPFTGDANSAYNNWGDNVNVNYVPFGVMSPHVDPSGKPEQWIVDEFVKYNGRSADNYDADDDNFNVQVPEGKTAREALGNSLRESSAEMFGRDFSDASDVEMLDALVYNVFPNFAPWGGFMPNIVYRWRPWPDQDHCLMEVRILMRNKPGEEMPKSVPMRLIGEDEKWSDLPEIGALGGVFEQDMENMAFVHDGLKASKNGNVELGNYQEIRVRQFHQTIDKYLSR